MRTATILRYRADGKTVVLPEVPRGRPPQRPGAFPSLSVVLALHGQRALTEACLPTIRADVPEAQIICVDNASPDDTRDWLATQAVRSVLLPANRGCAGGWNAGLEVATGEVLCVLNNDLLVNPGGLRRLAQAAWEQGIAAQTGGVLNPDLSFARMTEDAAEADYPEGFALAFRRDVWEAVGPFDAGMELGFWEDTDWGCAARMWGFRWVFVPEAVNHRRGATAATVPRIEAAREKNGRRFRQRWKGKGIGERLVVVRGGGLGDVIMATPIIRALRRDLPLARIHLRTVARHVDYFRDLPELDGVTTELVAGTTREIGLDGAYEGHHIAGEWVPAVQAYADRAGVTPDDWSYLAPDTQDLAAWAAELLPGTGYVALGIRSEFRPKVNWGEAHWLELVRARPDLTFVPLDGCERPSLEIKESWNGERLYDEPNVLDLTGKTPGPRHLLAILRRCAAGVTVDTGISHVAASAGIPLVLLFASGTPEGTAPRFGRVETFRGEAPCYPCTYRSRCPRVDGDEGPHCLAHVTGAQVAAALRRLLEG